MTRPMLAVATRAASPPLEHAPLPEWRSFMARLGLSGYAIKKQTHYYQHFHDRWPDLRLGATTVDQTTRPYPRSRNTRRAHRHRVLPGPRLPEVSGTDRPCRLRLGLRPGRRTAGMIDYADALGLRFNRTWLAQQREHGVRYGWAGDTITGALLWAHGRFILHNGHADPDRYGLADLHELRAQVIALNAQHAALSTRGSGDPATRLNAALGRLSGLHGFWFCQGKIDVPHTRPFRRQEPADDWPAPPRIAAVVERYCRQKSNITTPQGVQARRRELRLIVDWLLHEHRDMSTLAELHRQDIEAYLEHLATAPRPKHDRPVGIATRRQIISFLRQFFAETTEWDYDDVPGRQLISRADSPRAPSHIPRFIPDQELAAAMQAIRDLPDPHQRAALLTVRWSGARRDEIRRLELDCLDTYPDGTPRLRIPAGKTKAERMVPVAAEAADAIRDVQARRATDDDLGITDRVTGSQVRYLFLDRGRLRSPSYLYDEPLLHVGQKIGLVPASGTGNAITAHRFRHTVGTQLANKHARIKTIMAILGHSNATMAMVYSAISDQELLNDYTSALKPGAVIAGPAAELIRNNDLSARQLDWLNSNYFKSELELGACLKLPDEGPCECELFLTCAKFFTTTEHAPRIRHRWHREQQLIADALEHGWNREAERHQSLAQRCVDLLSDLGRTQRQRQRQRQPAPDRQLTAPFRV